MAVVYDDNESGRSAQAAFTASFTQFGTVVALPVTDDPGAAVDRVTALTPGTPILLATEERNGVLLVKGPYGRSSCSTTAMLPSHVPYVVVRIHRFRWIG